MTKQPSHRARFDAALNRLRMQGWRQHGEAGADEEAGPTIHLPEDFERHFTSDGTLTSEFDFSWHRGVAARIQTAFAEEELVVVLPLTEASGTGILLDESPDESDLCRIVRAFKVLRDRGYIAEPNLAFTSTDGWQDVHERSTEPNTPALFWNTQAHEGSFDDDGGLIDDLPLQWRGDPLVICEVLRTTALDVTVPGTADRTFFIRPS